MPWARARWSFAAYIGYPTPQCTFGDEVDKDAEPRDRGDGCGQGGWEGKSLTQFSCQPDQLLYWATADPLLVLKEQLDPHEGGVGGAAPVYQAIHFVLGEEAGVVGVSD